MRKIYSIVLMACAMLISASSFAETKNRSVGDWAGLQSAVAEASAEDGDVLNITLTTDITATSTTPVRISAKKAQAGITVNLNLNGHKIEATNMEHMFKLYKGTLKITGSGTITSNERTDGSNYVFFVAGSSDSTATNWSHLIIDKDVHIQALGSGHKGYAISINEVIAYSQSGGTYPVSADENMSEHLTEATKYQGITFTQKWEWMDYTTSWFTTSASKGQVGFAYGVVIDVYGEVYASKYGVKVNGNVTGKLALQANMVHLPTINVYPGATMRADNAKKSIAVYASGYANYNIQGTIIGGTGVYVKSGNVTIENADITSNYSGAYEPIPTDKPTKSGVVAGGSGVVIESNPNYAGGQSVTITGDTKIQGTCGYAVEETITTKGSETKVNSLTIEGGTFIAGGQGTIEVTKQTIETKNGEDYIVKVEGGNFDGNGNFVQVKDAETGEIVTAKVDDFLPSDNYFTTTVLDANNKSVTVVTNGTGFSEISKTEGNSVKTATGAIVWNNATTTSETLDDSKTLEYLEINNDYAQTLTVPDGKTLTVGRIVMGQNGKIIVKAGAKLIVTGKQGIVAPVASNIILETQEGKPAQFLFNPSVNSNRHPNATVEFKSKAYKIADGQFIYQFFGSPFIAVENITASSATYKTQLDVWNADHYDRIGIINSGSALDYSKFTTQFGFYCMTANNPEGDEQTYTMTGSIVGTEAPALPLYAGWTGMSNAFTAQIDVAALGDAMEARQDAGSKIEVSIYTYEQDGNELHWTPNNIVSMPQPQIDPMKPFMFHNIGTAKEELNMDYKALVWSPVFPDKQDLAPARRNMPSDMTKATIRVNGNGVSDIVTIAESDEFTSGRDRYDAVMYPNTDINLYVMDEEKMSIFATDDVENTYIGFACPKGGEFTLSFNAVEGKALTLVDLVNNASVDMTEGATYTFTAAANEANDYRFKVVNRRNAATALENTETAAKAEGIYTLTGMYLGNMSVWNTLPAGIYVVNGEKRVK